MSPPSVAASPTQPTTSPTAAAMPTHPPPKGASPSDVVFGAPIGSPQARMQVERLEGLDKDSYTMSTDDGPVGGGLVASSSSDSGHLGAATPESSGQGYAQSKVRRAHGSTSSERSGGAGGGLGPPTPAHASTPNSGATSGGGKSSQSGGMTDSVSSGSTRTSSGARSAAAHENVLVAGEGAPSGIKTLPGAFDDAEIDDVLVLVADMLDRLTAHNDRLPLHPSSLTRFHSRAAPNISVTSYLRRIARYTLLDKSCALILLVYIDRVCERMAGFTISSLTVHRFICAAVVCASKALCDAFSTNGHYARVGGISLVELNLLEKEFLHTIDWRLTCSGALLQHYYTSLVRSHPSYSLSRGKNSSSSATGSTSGRSGGGGGDAGSLSRRTSSSVGSASSPRAEGDDARMESSGTVAARRSSGSARTAPSPAPRVHAAAPAAAAGAVGASSGQTASGASTAVASSGPSGGSAAEASGPLASTSSYPSSAPPPPTPPPRSSATHHGHSWDALRDGVDHDEDGGDSGSGGSRHGQIDEALTTATAVEQGGEGGGGIDDDQDDGAAAGLAPPRSAPPSHAHGRKRRLEGAEADASSPAAAGLPSTPQHHHHSHHHPHHHHAEPAGIAAVMMAVDDQEEDGGAAANGRQTHIDDGRNAH